MRDIVCLKTEKLLKTILASLITLTITQIALAQALDSVSTPEPATFLLLGTGLAGMGLIAWRRNRKK